LVEITDNLKPGNSFQEEIPDFFMLTNQRLKTLDKSLLLCENYAVFPKNSLLGESGHFQSCELVMAVYWQHAFPLSSLVSAPVYESVIL
jgi:hypothetical protein